MTEGKPAVTEIIPQGIGERELLTLVAAAQRGSEHPLARAVLARAEGLELPTLEEFWSHAGLGLTARVDGRWLAIGNRRLMSEKHVPMDEAEAQVARLEERSRTVMWAAAIDAPARLLGIIAVADPVRPTARAAVRHLQESASRPYC